MLEEYNTLPMYPGKPYNLISREASNSVVQQAPQMKIVSGHVYTAETQENLWNVPLYSLQLAASLLSAP